MDVVDAWEDDLKKRYPEPDAKQPAEFRDYEGANDSVREFYRLNHKNQTLAFVRAKEEMYRPRQKAKMGVWEAIEFLDTLVDESDPDTEVPQIVHALQSAEAIRAAGHPRWFILTGLIHDLGKILCLWDEPQWAVVGDTFPVGCAFSDKIVYPEYFSENPDSADPLYQTPTGIYEEGGGLDQIHMSWGHDEYMYYVAREYLPEEALYMIRYHSFYPGHRENAYDHLMNDHDREMFKWVRAFNPFDLYTKSDDPPDVDKLTPFYRDLIDEFFPAEISW